MKKILTAEAATIIGTSPQFVRIAMVLSFYTERLSVR